MGHYSLDAEQPSSGGRRSPPLPLTSLSDSFVTSPGCPASLVTRPSLSSLTMVGSGGLCARALPSHLLQLQICSSLFPDAQTEEATHPQPFRSAQLFPTPFHNPIQVFNSKCRFSKKHFTDEGWGPQDEYLPPPPPSADLASTPGQLDPSIPSPQLTGIPLSTKPSSCLSVTTAWLAPLLPC